MAPVNPNSARRARRRDPLRRAVGAPRLTPAAPACPRGECEHTEMTHELRVDGSDRPTIERIRCTVATCGCGEN